MKLIDKIVQKKVKKEMKAMGIDDAKLDIDVSGISAEDMMKMEKKFKGFISKHPTLAKLKLDSLPALLRHKDELKKIFDENKDEVQELMAQIKKETKKK
jgi:hypothetical protein